MAGEQTITVKVPDVLAKRIQSAVERGEFASPSDVVCAALDLWSVEGEQEPEIEQLRKLWLEGVESGSGRFASIDDIKAEGRRRISSS